LSPLILRLRVGHDRSLHEEHKTARIALDAAAAAAIDRIAKEEEAPADLAARIRAEFADKIALAVPDPESARQMEITEPSAGLSRRLRRAAIDAERKELLRIWRDNRISDDVLHHIEEELDYQESHV
jgi:CPA1 family monovalent cation:H+ antiporter